MKRLLTASFIIAACICFAADNTDTNALTKAERRRIRREQRVIREGGMVTKPNLGREIRFVDAQKSVAHDAVEEAAKTVGEVVNVPFRVTSEEAAEPFTLAAKVAKEKSVGAAILLVNDARLPSITVAPEKSWAIVNVKPLSDDFPPKNVLALRVRKELVRAAAWALGAGESMMKPCIMQYEPTVADLDANRLLVPSPDPLMRMVNGALARGIDTIRIDTYKRACQEGWAPTPTNDVQKAIWDEIHALPTEPIKIKPETKKVSD